VPEVGSKIAEAYVQIGTDLNPYNAGLNTVKRSLFGLAGMRFNLPGGGLLSALGIGAGGLGIAGAVLGIKSAIGAASNLAETTTKTQAVFHGASDQVFALADSMAKAFGLPKQEILDAASTIGLVGKASGQSEEEAAAMAVSMAKLAADASSFYNTSLDVALEKIRSGLVGEAEPLRQFGVLLSETAVQQQALAMGATLTGGKLSEQAKVAARAAIITRQLHDATGDLERTQGGVANQSRRFSGTLQNLATDIGTALLPAFNEFIVLLNEMAGDLADAFGDTTSRVAGFVDGLRSALETASFVYRNFGDIVELAQIGIAEKVANVGETFRFLQETAAAFLDWFGANWSNIFLDAFDLIGQALARLGEDFAGFGRAAYDWIASGFTKPFDFTLSAGIDTSRLRTSPLELPNPADFGVNMDRERQAVEDRIAERERTRTEGQGQAAAQQGKAADAAAAVAAKVKPAEIVNVASIADSIAKAALGQRDPLLKEAQAQTEKLDQIATNTAKAAAGGKAKFAGP
jgi:hypothetical protein